MRNISIALLRSPPLRGFLAAATCWLLAAPSRAQASGPDALAAALQKFEVGRAAFDAGRFAEGLGAFQASFDLSPSPNSRLYVGRCYKALGKVASAYTSLRMAAREAQDRVVATGEKRYAATRDAANSEAAEIEPKVPRLTLAVPSGVPVGFVVKVNGSELPRAAWGVAVETDPGDVVVEAGGPRVVPFVDRFHLAVAEQHRVDVRADHVPTGKLVLRFKSRPVGVAVAIDREAVDGSQIEAGRDVEVGAHEITVNAPGYAPFVWKGTLTDGQTAEAVVDLRPSASAVAGRTGTPAWLFFTVGGSAAVSLGVASVIAIRAKAAADAELAKDPYSRDVNARDAIRSQSSTANILFVGGGVLAVGAAVLGFTTQWRSPEHRSESALRVSPWIGSGIAGVGAHGRF